ncbi:MAG: phosphatidylserine decarboxylase [Lachnospiraceae bacterium]|nr:phosphatidylserine decarboxylase [Lachnospiraceae bacterium]
MKQINRKPSESIALRFLYHTVAGRTILKILVCPFVSKIAGAVLDSKASAALIPWFRKKNGISMEGVIVPKGGFPSFNAFFCRKRRMGCVEENKALSSPCDAYLTCIPIHKNQIFDIKHTRFSLQDLLQDKELAREFTDGIALIFRLTPSHYHRYAYAADGRVLSWRRVRGVLHSVRPVCTRKVPVYAQNAREYQVIETKELGKIVQMEIGAMMIGHISNEKPVDRKSVRGREKGKFEFGGSTIMLLLQKDCVSLRKEVMEAGRDGGELAVSYGESLTE